MIQPPENLRSFNALVQVVQALRGPEGCPWDKEQTLESLVRFAIEEVHEYAEAVDAGDHPLMKEELGDILLQVVLNSVVAEQAEKFDLEDVIESITEKMVRRHPHVFADENIPTTEQVRQNWEDIKAQEKPKRSFGFNLPAGIPALLAALKIGEKTKKVEFDWKQPDQVREKLNEELTELGEAISQSDELAIEAELGDCLFTLAQWSRHLNVDPEQALRKANTRFENRYIYMQQKLHEKAKTLLDISSDEKEKLWLQAKNNLK